MIRRVARQVDEDLPRGFVRHLPELASGPAKGLPRIYALARALVLGRSLDFDVTALRRFVERYQEVSPLTIAELWALPTMLRVSVLRGLLRFLQDLQVVDADDRPIEPLSLDPGAGVERAVRALRLLSDIRWEAFFEEINRVEAILRKDPAQIYARMEFATCDAYRKVVEDLAWATGHPEEDVANRALALAREQFPDERRGHVGFYLVDDGRRLLEEHIRYHRPRGLDRARRALSWPAHLFTYLASLSLSLHGGAAAVRRARPRYVAHAG